jgi:hypothetical protein
MRMPSEPVNLSAEEINELNQKLSNLRHDVNNHLSLILAATELIRHKPQMSEKMLNTLCEQPPKITGAMAKFTTDFENALGIKRS